jgi:hypothetical protein
VTGSAALFALEELICGKVQARADDGGIEFVLVCHRPAGHEGPCRALGWTEAQK